MMFIRNFLLVVFIVASFFSYSCNANDLNSEDINEVKCVLKSGGFSGVIDGSEKIELMGHLKVDTTVVRVYYYAREFGSHRLTQRLLFISSDSKYIGMFSVNDKPISVEGRQVLFEYDLDVGNAVQLTNDGVPQSVRLDGEIVELFR